MINNNNNNNNNSSLAMMKQAHAAAERQTKEWIRATLREVALQSLRQQWSLEPATTTTTTAIVRLPEHAVTVAQHHGRTVATAWQHALREMGQHTVAAWIDQVLGQSHAWYDAIQEQEEQQQQEQQQQQQQGQQQQEQGQQQQEQPTPNHSTTTTTNTTTTQPYITALGRLQQLGARNVLAPDDPNTDPMASSSSSSSSTAAAAAAVSAAIQGLDQSGRRGDTEWPPHAWPYIQHAAQRLPLRLASTRSASGENMDDDVVVVVVVNERRAKPNNNNNNNNNIDNNNNNNIDHNNDDNDEEYPTDLIAAKQEQRQAEELLIRRKRKGGRLKVPVLPPPLKRSSVPRVDPDPPRAPSNLTEQRMSYQEMKREWSETERQRLYHQCLHPERSNQDEEQPAAAAAAAGQNSPSEPDTTNKNETYNDDDDDHAPMCILLGPLRDTGRFHFWNQQLVDQANDDNATKPGTVRSERQQRLDKRRAIKERLGDHTEEKDYGATGRVRVSRILSTVDPAGNHWWDADLGYSTLEWIDPTTNRRELYFFSSVECILLDEDDSKSDVLTLAEDEPSLAADGSAVL